MFKEENIPLEMKGKKQWVCYRKKSEDGKTKKFMLNPSDLTFAKANDPTTWSSFLTAMKSLRKKQLHIDGLAFVLTGGYVFIDTDHSIDGDGNVNELSKKLLSLLPATYAEKSCSGHGIHIIAKGSLEKEAKKRNDSLGIEIYDSKRFLCMTGDVIDGRKEIVSYPKEIEEISKSIVGWMPPPRKIERIAPSMSEREIIEKIRKSRQGDKFSALYEGDISGYPSASNADFAMASLLAFWTQDGNQIASIMLSSGLAREKWEKNASYLTTTIKKALSLCPKAYKGECEM